jgi:biopolymer transport protein ExbD
VITRPLDLLSKLRPAPRNYDFLFLVNGGLIALFFSLFGSRFVLSPGLRVENTDLTLRTSPNAVESAVATRVTIRVNASGQILGDTGLINEANLKSWLAEQAKRAPGSVLLLIPDSRASIDICAVISETATAVGFNGVQIAAQQTPAAVANEVKFPK